MAAPVTIRDPATKKGACVRPSTGELIVGKFDYDDVANATVAAATGYNLFGPIAGKQFVITSIYLTAKKDITTDVIIDIYEADGPSETTVSKEILQVELLKNTNTQFNPLNILTSKGKWLNVKADDITVLCTLTGYYIPEV